MRRGAALGGVLAVIGIGLAWMGHVWPPESDDRSRRAALITLARPHWPATRVESSLDATDRVAARLAEAGVSDAGAWVTRRLREVEITEREGRAFHAANPHVFGGRPYEASRSQVSHSAGPAAGEIHFAASRLNIRLTSV